MKQVQFYCHIISQTCVKEYRITQRINEVDFFRNINFKCGFLNTIFIWKNCVFSPKNYLNIKIIKRLGISEANNMRCTVAIFVTLDTGNLAV